MKTKTFALTNETPTKCPYTRTVNFIRGFLGLKPAQALQPSQGRCPYGFDAIPEKKPESAFIDKAAHEAASAPVLLGDPRASELLQQARDNIYHWPEAFAGFHCDLEIISSGKKYSGFLHSVSSRNYELVVPDFEPMKWLRFQIEEFLAHREHPSVSRMASRTGLSLGDEDPIFGQRIDFLGDGMNSYYRLKDNKITWIGRSYAKQSFFITIDEHLNCHGKFTSTRYTAYYRDKATGNLVKTESFMDDYLLFNEIYLPKNRRYMEVTQKDEFCRSIKFMNHRLL
ncbi:MAG: DUF3386 family protein [Blastochloris sp.]|nr:DUF3386 family protein [Blastochloris sp.]